MTTRNESVRLSLIDDGFSTGMAKAAAATALFDRYLNNVDGTSLQAGKTLRTSSSDVDRFGTALRRNGADINQFSGRLRYMAEAASVLGPGVGVLAAPGVGVLAGMTAQLGAVAGAVGVSVLAFNGMGEGLEAINAYQLEPTAENLQAMRIEMERLGPAGAEFATFIDELGPQLSTVQMAAREGLLPGVTEGIENLLPLLPKVRTIISDIAEAMGGLASSAGSSLAGDDFAAFFDYLDREAGPLLVEFGNTVGNFAQGFAGLLVGLGPLTRDFSGGLEAMSESFANWSANLGDNSAFQEFLSYVQESGPKAVEFLGEMATAFAAILTAAAPVGDLVLPALTELVSIIGDLAASPIGPIFIGAAAAMSVYSRGAALADAATKRLAASAAVAGSQVSRSSALMARGATGFGLLANNFGKASAAAGIVALSMTDVDEKAGLANTATLGLAGSLAGPWGAAAGAAIGFTMDLASANDDLAAAVEQARDAMNGSAQEQAAAARTLEAQIRAVQSARDNLIGDKTEVGFAEDLMNEMKAIESFLGWGPDIASSRMELDSLNDAMRQGGTIADIFGRDMGLTAQEIRGASSAARDFSGQLAVMGGWLDKREALRQYQEELKNFGKALENGFQPKNVEGLDRVAAGILQVASQIKNVEVRKDFMANARASLEEFAATGPKARAAVEKVIDKFVDLGLMKPKPRIDVDTKEADGKLSATGKTIRSLDRQTAAPKVSVPGASEAISTMDRLAAELSGLPREVVSNIRINTYRSTITNQAGPAYRAAGGPIYGPGGPRDDRIPAMLSNGEYVIQAAAVDRVGLPFLDHVNSLHFATGGYVDPLRRDALALASGGLVDCRATWGQVMA